MSTATHTCDPAKCCATCHDKAIARLRRLIAWHEDRNQFVAALKVRATLALPGCRCGCD